MMTKAFWIWRRLKDKKENFPIFHENVDYNLAVALVDASLSKNKPRGDGKFSRIENYTIELREEIEWIRKNWTGTDEDLNSFLLGCDCMISGFERAIENIKKGR